MTRFRSISPSIIQIKTKVTSNFIIRQMLIPLPPRLKYGFNSTSKVQSVHGCNN